MNKPQYFDISEFLKSETALKKKIENIPDSWDIIENLQDLALFLDGIRQAWGSGIRITSGYRSLQLNKAVGGVNGSQHCYGLAADIKPSNGKIAEFEKFLKEYLKDKAFDTVIWETSKSSGSRWIHIQHYNRKGEQRRRMFNMLAA